MDTLEQKLDEINNSLDGLATDASRTLDTLSRHTEILEELAGSVDKIVTVLGGLSDGINRIADTLDVIAAQLSTFKSADESLKANIGQVSTVIAIKVLEQVIPEQAKAMTQTFKAFLDKEDNQAALARFKRKSYE